MRSKGWRDLAIYAERDWANLEGTGYSNTRGTWLWINLNLLCKMCMICKPVTSQVSKILIVESHIVVVTQSSSLISISFELLIA